MHVCVCLRSSGTSKSDSTYDEFEKGRGGMKNGQNHWGFLFVCFLFGKVFATHILSMSTQKAQTHYSGIPLLHGKYNFTFQRPFPQNLHFVYF